MEGKQILALALWFSAFTAGGCARVEQQVLTWMPPPNPVDQQAVEMRMDFQSSGSSSAIRWLLAHHVEQGMSPGGVAEVLGDAGRRVHDDGWITNDGGTFQVGDETYKWGPDSQGNGYFLVFREGKLVGFDPAQFE